MFAYLNTHLCCATTRRTMTINNICVIIRHCARGDLLRQRPDTIRQAQSEHNKHVSRNDSNDSDLKCQTWCGPRRRLIPHPSMSEIVHRRLGHTVPFIFHPSLAFSVCSSELLICRCAARHGMDFCVRAVAAASATKFHVVLLRCVAFRSGGTPSLFKVTRDARHGYVARVVSSVRCCRSNWAASVLCVCMCSYCRFIPMFVCVLMRNAAYRMYTGRHSFTYS